MGNLPPANSYFNWHYRQALPSFIENRLKQLAETFIYFNITGLVKNLFAPYRRLEVPKNIPQLEITGLFDRISFNLISRSIGAVVRTILILAGITGFILIAIFEFFYILAWILLPFLSFPQYRKLQSKTFFARDLISPEYFLKKLKGNSLFKLLVLFFEDDFENCFTNLQPQTLAIAPNSKFSSVIMTLAKNWPNLQHYLEQKNITQEQFKVLVNALNEYLKNVPQLALTPLGQMLSFGYTRNLDKFTSRLAGQNLLLSPSEKEVLWQIEKILARPQNNNVLLVGEPGVGKHAILESLATAIARLQLPALAGKQVVVLDTIALAGTGKNLVEVKSNFETVLAEARAAGNIILVINQIDRLTSSKDGRLDLSEVLVTVLKDNALPIIGLATIDNFSQYIRPNTSFLNLFEKIGVGESNFGETLAILIAQAFTFWRKEKIKTPLNALIEIVGRSNQLMPERQQPEKAIILLADAIAEAKRRDQHQLNISLIDEIVSGQTKIPIGQIAPKEAEKLKNLEAILHQRIIGQNEAIDQIAKALRRARTGIEAGTRPIGSFLFLGPTGVGKTETAKALAIVYFGSEERMLRLDMSEFASTDALVRLIGDRDHEIPGQLATMIRENPYSLLLVDEFEKAHQNVHNLFLQILDEGFFTDAFGKKVSFDNIIIIATSNAAGEFIREQVVKHIPDLTKILIDYVLREGHFNPELLNRFDGVVVYRPLNPNQVVAVTELMLKRLSSQLKDSKNITLELTNQLAQQIALKSFDPTFGARPVRRFIQDKIEDGIAKMIIDGSVKNGDKIAANALLKFVS